MSTDLILGTAGHIDHGKTSLIRALTGTNTDRLPEEKKRGITIELGFAHLELGEFRLGIVDVPGHERFVRNMLAGATGMDLALLVVAADDSVKPQTEEHLEILRLLDLEAGVIALTKCDLVDLDWLALVTDEIRELVAGTFLAEAPVVPTSAATGEGLDELKERLTAAATLAAGGTRPDRVNAPFRMAIDRAFTLAGHGTVVTGSVSSGRARKGDELVLEPGEIPVRVRGLQNHDESVDEIERGQRAAVNLGGVHHDEIRRGQELCEAGHLRGSQLLTVELAVLEGASRPLKDRSRLRLHIGTAEILSSIRLLDHDVLSPGQLGLAQLFLNKPAVAVWSQPFVLRSESPIRTIGGGRILDPNAERLQKPDAQQLEMLDLLRSRDPVARASGALYFSGLRDFQPKDLPRTAGVGAYHDTFRLLVEQQDVREISLSHSRSLRLHEQVFQKLADRVVVVMNKLHDAHPLRTVLDRQQVHRSFQYLPNDAILDVVFRELQSQKRVRVSPQGIAVVGRGPKLSQNERKLLTQLVEDFLQAGIEVPTVKQYQKSVSKNQESVPQLIALAAANGDLVEVSTDIYVHRDIEHQFRDLLASKLMASSGLTMSEIREILNTSRKYAVPFCEYLDRIGFTERQGDVRVLAAETDA
jgi:selenocysteine-specific elongation factor